MNRLARYILRELLITTFALVALITTIMWVVGSLRRLEVIIASGAPLTLLGQVLLLTLPSILSVMIPLALAISLIFCYYKLQADSELVAMQAFGLTNWQLAKPALYWGSCLTCLGLVLNLYINPLAQQSLSSLRISLRDIIPLLQEDTFTDLTDQLTFYMHRRLTDNTMQGVLLYDRRDAELTLIAERASLIYTATTLHLTLSHGVRQLRDQDTFSELYFEHYATELPLVELGPSQRPQKTRERSTFDLIYPAADNTYSNEQLRSFTAELHRRLAQPFLSITFAFVATACLLIIPTRDRRQTKWLPLLTAASIIILLQSLILGLSRLSFAPLFLVSGGIFATTIIIAWWLLKR